MSRDNRDPELLGKTILLLKQNGMSITDAADAATEQVPEGAHRAVVNALLRPNGHGPSPSLDQP